MILLLCQREYQILVESVASDLKTTFNGHAEVELAFADDDKLWDKEANWDDLLVVFFDEKPFPGPGENLLKDYLQKRSDKGLLLPVALKSSHTHPPTPAAKIKAFTFDSVTPEIQARLVR